MRLPSAILLSSIILASCLEDYPAAPSSPFEKPALAFVESLIVPATGLVASRPGECFTTVYKNALAAMSFLHEGNHAAATRILDHFAAFLDNQTTAFWGFPQDWDPCTGLPLNDNRWEGDNAFLLLALNYYSLTSSQPDRYFNLTLELVNWLSFRGLKCGEIVAEGTANMYAALLPHASNPSVSQSLELLEECSSNDLVFYLVLDHTVRGALVFGRYSGFDQLANFKITENWSVTGEPIVAYKAFANDTLANVEISAQLLLAAKLTGQSHQVPGLRQELEKLWIRTNSGRAAGLPYFLQNTGFPQAAELGIVDPTIYMLFYYWNFNPFQPKVRYAP
ncbi:MAG: hypothetical protein JNN04_04390 [Cyclobacteriaceae bacterium]|nr:hypothetical protein [Cyclobacteriaceae bacterium]